MKKLLASFIILSSISIAYALENSTTPFETQVKKQPKKILFLQRKSPNLQNELMQVEQKSNIKLDIEQIEKNMLLEYSTNQTNVMIP